MTLTVDDLLRRAIESVIAWYDATQRSGRTRWRSGHRPAPGIGSVLRDLRADISGPNSLVVAHNAVTVRGEMHFTSPWHFRRGYRIGRRPQLSLELLIHQGLHIVLHRCHTGAKSKARVCCPIEMPSMHQRSWTDYNASCCGGADEKALACFASGTIRTMKLLQCACIVGAVTVLSLLTARGPSNISEPVREPAGARGRERCGPIDDAQASVTVLNAAPIKLASLEDAHVNPVAPLSPFALTSAYPMPMSLPHERTMAPAETPNATLRRRVAGSAEALPEQFVKALAAADPMPVGALLPTRLAYAAAPDVTFDPTSHASPSLKRETPDLSYLAYYAYSEAPPPESPADTVLRELKEIPEGTPIEEVRRAAQVFGLDVTFMEAVSKIESDF